MNFKLQNFDIKLNHKFKIFIKIVQNFKQNIIAQERMFQIVLKVMTPT